MAGNLKAGRSKFSSRTDSVVTKVQFLPKQKLLRNWFRAIPKLIRFHCIFSCQIYCQGVEYRGKPATCMYCILYTEHFSLYLFLFCSCSVNCIWFSRDLYWARFGRPGWSAAWLVPAASWECQAEQLWEHRGQPSDWYADYFPCGVYKHVHQHDISCTGPERLIQSTVSLLMFVPPISVLPKGTERLGGKLCIQGVSCWIALLGLYHFRVQMVSCLSECSPMSEIPHLWNACMQGKRILTQTSSSDTHVLHVGSFRCGRTINHVIAKPPDWYCRI